MNLQPLQEMYASAARWMTVCLVAVFLIGPIGVSADAAQIKVNEEVKMQFSFSETPWPKVIEFFTKQTGLAYQPTTKPPTGSFTWLSPQMYTIAEGMDVLNEALLREGITITRKGSMLVLQRFEDFDNRLVDTIAPEAIPERGKYEVFRVIYEMDGIENLGIEEEIRAMIGQNQYNALNKFPASAQMVVIELGYRHREIQRILVKSTIKARENTLQYSTYKMKHVSVEALMGAVREFMGFPEDSFESADQLIKISVEPLGDNLRLAATEDKRQEFLKIAALIDIAPEVIGQSDPLERPYLRVYNPGIDPELAFRIIDSNLAGRDGVIMEQDPVSGQIMVMGRKADHEIVQHILDILKGQTPDYAVFTLVNADSDDVLEKLNNFFRLEDGETNPDAPVIFEDEDLNQILVRGKPSDIETIRRMVEEFDKNAVREYGPRTTSRFVEMDPEDAETTMDLLGDLFPTTGRQNQLNVVMPEDRSKFRRRGIVIDRGQGSSYNENQGDGENKIDFPSREELEQEFDKLLKEKLPEKKSNEGASFHPDDGYQFVSCPAPTQEQDLIGESSDESNSEENYQAPVEQPSVPGAPITVKWTAEGIRIDSLDLDALDDLEVLLRNRAKKRSKKVGPHIVPFINTRVEDKKPVLDKIFGLESGGGGGGGGVADAMSSALKNMGGAGDLLAGVMGGGGGGGGGGSAAIELEGEDVVFAPDIRNNALMIFNATENDMREIIQMVEWLDQANPPQQLDTAGDTYVIPVYHYNVEDLSELIQSMLTDYIQGSGGNQGNQARQQNPAVQMQNMVRAMAGGKGGQAQQSTEEVPKATLTADVRNSNLVLIGPDYIYEKVLEIVEKLDVRGAKKSDHLYNPNGMMAAETLAQTLQAIYGDQIEIIGEEESGRGGSSSGRNTNGAKTPTASNNDPRAQFLRAMQQQQQRNEGGNRGGARGNRGGGNRQGGARGRGR